MFLDVILVTIIPILIILYLFRKNWKVASISIGLLLMFNTSIIAIASYNKNMDTEILNGRVTGKHRETVSCSHSYPCHPRTVCSGSGKSRSCSTVYDTCYEHFHDYDWVVKTTIQDVNIDRVDRQGTEEPPRFTKVKIGEPASFEHSYQNYIKGSDNSIFKKQVNSNYKDIPLQTPYDYYRYNHVIVDGVNYNINNLNNKLTELNADIGTSKQVNIRVVLTNKKEDFAEVMRNRWLGGKKNELNVFIGTDGSKILWTRVFSWSYNDMVNVSIQSDLLQLGHLDDDKIVDSIKTNTLKYYSRKQMKDFKYLDEEYKPMDTWIYILLCVLNFGSIGAYLWCSKRSKPRTTFGYYNQPKFKFKRNFFK